MTITQTLFAELMEVRVKIDTLRADLQSNRIQHADEIDRNHVTAQLESMRSIITGISKRWQSG